MRVSAVCPPSVTLLLSAVAVGSLAGCTAAREEARWGAAVTVQPGWRSAEDAAVAAASDEGVWIPLAGAILLQFGDFDRRVSDWARDHTPIAGSNDRAADLSDRLLDASRASYWITIVASVSGDDTGSWVSDKLQGTALGLVATNVPAGATWALKQVTDRRRPDGSDRLSFPSGHASYSTAHATLAGRTLPFIRMRPRARSGCELALLTMTIGCAWCRVEAGKHYPSDALAGIALGRFLAAFLEDAFTQGSRRSASGVAIVGDSERLGVRFTF